MITCYERQNAISVDVEDYFHVAALSRVISPSDWDGIAPRVAANTQRLMDLFDERSVSATFFVLGWVAERFPGMVREITARGHELACHGMNHQLVYKQSRGEFRDETRRAKQVLEDAAGTRVLGYRAASYSITEASLWALDELIDAGFEYDSSIFPVAHDIYGIPGAQRFIHEREAPSGRRLVEFPPTTARLFGRNVPAAGGGYFRLYPYWVTRALIRRVMAEGEPVMFYLHPWEVDPDQPRVKASLKSRFRHYNNLDKCLPRLRRLTSEFRFATARDVIAESQRLVQPALVGA
ncbi:MAG: XrtA system polysaccharide deacetylase [Pseudomonadota bacterium]